MTPADVVVGRFAAAVDREALGASGIHVLVGDDEAQHRWCSDDREDVYSVSKGICAIAAGIAIDEGLLHVDTTVAEALPLMRLGDGVAAVTLRHLLTMTSGIDFQWFGSQPVPWPDLAAEMLQHPTRGPGTVFQYSDASSYVAMRMLGASVGDVRDWLLPRLFDPLEIHDPQWHRCPRGWIVGGSGLELRTGELARFGRLLRDRGEWRGVRLVPAAVSTACTRTSSTREVLRRTSGTGSRRGRAPTTAGDSTARTGSTWSSTTHATPSSPSPRMRIIGTDHRLAELAAQALTAVLPG